MINIFFYTGLIFYIIVLLICLYYIDKILCKKVPYYVVLRNHISFPFIMIWVTFFTTKQLENCKKMHELAISEKTKIYYLTKYGLKYAIFLLKFRK